MGMDEASALESALWWSCACRVLSICNMCLCFDYTDGALAWTRQAPQYVPSVHCMCLGIVACVTGDGLCCPKSLHANKQRTRVI